MKDTMENERTGLNNKEVSVASQICMESMEFSFCKRIQCLISINTYHLLVI